MTDAVFQKDRSRSAHENAPDEVAALKQRIDDIAAFREPDRPWYKDTRLAVSAAAIFISIMTTAVSWYRTYQQDVAALQTQLRATLQQTNQISLLHIELPAKFKDNQNDFLNASSTLNQQNLMFAQQAYSIAKELGKAASSLELTATAAALINSGQIGLAEELLKSAVDRATNSMEYTSAARTLAAIQFQHGQRAEAAATFKNIVQVFERFSNEGNYGFNVNLTQAYSYIFWTGVVMAADCRLAKQSLAESGQYMAQLPAANAAVSAMQSQVRNFNTALAGCQ